MTNTKFKEDVGQTEVFYAAGENVIGCTTWENRVVISLV